MEDTASAPEVSQIIGQVPSTFLASEAALPGMLADARVGWHKHICQQQQLPCLEG